MLNLTFLVINLCLDVFNAITALNFKSYGLASQCLDKDLHLSSSK